MKKFEIGDHVIHEKYKVQGVVTGIRGIWYVVLFPFVDDVFSVKLEGQIGEEIFESHELEKIEVEDETV